MIFRYTCTDQPIIQNISNPDSIFHYTKRNIALENILGNNEFKFSKLSNTDDPHEYEHLIFGGVGWGKIYSQKISKDLFELSDRLNDVIKNRSAFLSFCKNHYDSDHNILGYGCLKPRMWSQYGEKHQGICLIFSKKRILNESIKKFKNKCRYIMNEDVQYYNYIGDYIDDVLTIDLDFLKKNSINKSFDKQLTILKDKIFFLKHQDYKDEDEFRIVILDYKCNEHDLYVNIKNCITGIIVGENFNKAYNLNIEKYAKKNKIIYSKIHYGNCEYFLLSKL